MIGVWVNILFLGPIICLFVASVVVVLIDHWRNERKKDENTVTGHPDTGKHVSTDRGKGKDDEDKDVDTQPERENETHSERQHRKCEIVVGGLYAHLHKDGSYRVEKVLAAGESNLHLRLYKNKFAKIPWDLDSSGLSLGTIHDEDGFGVGHFPLGREGFYRDEPVLLSQEAVKEEELAGLRMYMETAFEILIGGLYAVCLPDGTYRIIKLLGYFHDKTIIVRNHIEIFSEIPSDVSSADLSPGYFHADPDSFSEKKYVYATRSDLIKLNLFFLRQESTEKEEMDELRGYGWEKRLPRLAADRSNWLELREAMKWNVDYIPERVWANIVHNQDFQEVFPKIVQDMLSRHYAHGESGARIDTAFAIKTIQSAGDQGAKPLLDSVLSVKAEPCAWPESGHWPPYLPTGLWEQNIQDKHQVLIKALSDVLPEDERCSSKTDSCTLGDLVDLWRRQGKKPRFQGDFNKKDEKDSDTR